MNLKFGKYWEISEKDLLKFCQKLQKSSKNFCVKIKLLFIAKDLQYKIHLLNMSYDSNTKKILKRSSYANSERDFIMFLPNIHTGFRSSYLEPSTLKRLQ